MSSTQGVAVGKQVLEVESEAVGLTAGHEPSGATVTPQTALPKSDAVSVQSWLATAAVVISWFVLNISMSSSTKWIFVNGRICVEGTGCTQYKFPLAITVIHMIFSWALCRFYIFHVRADAEAGLTYQQQLKEIMPLSTCFALSVAMGNMSLKYIYPSFNQMLGSMSPLITVLLAVVLQQKSFSMKTWLSMPVICIGLALCSFKELNFNVLGTFFAIGATVLRAVKSLIQGKLLSSKMDSVSLLYYMAPMSAFVLSFLMIFIEGLEPITLLVAPAKPGTPVTGLGTLIFLLMLSGLNACLLNIANFLVTSYTSPVTLQVLGNVKSCLGIAVSVAIFKNSITIEQLLGVFTCLFGVWIYNQKEPPPPASTTLPTSGKRMPVGAS